MSFTKMYHYHELFYQIILHVMYFTNNPTCITICRENARYSLHVLFCNILQQISHENAIIYFLGRKQ